MGRPLNKRNFGQPTAGGNEIKVQFHNGTASVDGWIVKQMGSKKFRCSDGTAEAVCFMVDKLAGALGPGEMTINVKDDAANVKQVIKIAAHKATVDTGESIGWTFDDSTSDARVEIEEAGEPGAAPIAIAITAAVVGAEYTITVAGTTDFTLYGAADSIPGTVFTVDADPSAAIGGGTVTATVATPTGDDTFGL